MARVTEPNSRNARASASRLADGRASAYVICRRQCVAESLPRNYGRRVICDAVAATEVDPIDVSSAESSSSHGLSSPCHDTKTTDRFVPLTAEHEAVVAEFRRFVETPSDCVRPTTMSARTPAGDKGWPTPAA